MNRVGIASPALPSRNDIRADEDIKKLLDVISSILADEYIQIAKENPDVFKNGATK